MNASGIKFGIDYAVEYRDAHGHNEIVPVRILKHTTVRTGAKGGAKNIYLGAIVDGREERVEFEFEAKNVISTVEEHEKLTAEREARVEASKRVAAEAEAKRQRAVDLLAAIMNVEAPQKDSAKKHRPKNEFLGISWDSITVEDAGLDALIAALEKHVS